MPETLTAEMEAEHRKWARGTRVYGTTYPSVRLLLIVASAAVSAKDNLSGSPLGDLILRARGVRPEESEVLDEVRTAFAGLRRRHHEANVY